MRAQTEPCGDPLALLIPKQIGQDGTPAGIQIDSPAILTGPFGDGRVVGISPHPEQSDSLRKIVPKLIEWSASRDTRWVNHEGNESD